jgi:excinuclease UvrABC nuclease subunit
LKKTAIFSQVAWGIARKTRKYADNRHMLAKLNRIATQLAKIENIDEAKSLRDKAEALRIYAKQQQVSEEIERQIVIVRLRTEKKRCVARLSWRAREEGQTPWCIWKVWRGPRR